MEITLDDIRTVVREEIVAATRVKYLDIKAACEYTGMAEGSIRNAVHQGRLRRVGEPGTALRFRIEDLDEFMARRRG